ncbi:uncharacterized protein LOC109829878 isoform X2 [Asparagus officinalis]|nr:uncharacterized protein LOC109829878 isoform X2 [Asparagus officinalis]XP_020252546.1 uncharacterized protein LOC109829878 isoform X2 [Asparagus officinalis]
MKYDEIILPVHPDHVLKLKTKAKPYTCNGCYEYGLHTRYTCNEPSCNFHLHKACALGSIHEPTITHAFYPNRTFLFLASPENAGQICNACAREIKGCNYHCFDEDLYLHPSCAKLPFTRDEGDVKLALKYKVSSKCYKCKKKKYKDEKRSWSYACEDCHLHVACVKDMLIEDWERGYLGHGGGSGKGKAKVKDEMALVATEMPKLQIVIDKGKKKWSSKLAKIVKYMKIIIASIIGAVTGDPTALVLSLISSTSSG